jgi:Protein of unknown function (DUF4242)
MHFRPKGPYRLDVPEFLAEVYLSRAAGETTVPGPAEVATAADQLRAEGILVRLLRSIFVPEDETCFYLFQAQSSDAVREAATRADLRFDRVMSAISKWTAHSGSD